MGPNVHLLAHSNLDMYAVYTVLCTGCKSRHRHRGPSGFFPPQAVWTCIVGCTPQTTFIPRASQCLSHRRNRDPQTLSRKRVFPPPPPPRSPRGRGHTRLRVRGVSGSQFRRLETKLSIMPSLWRLSLSKFNPCVFFPPKQYGRAGCTFQLRQFL